MIDYERKKDYVRIPRDLYEEVKKAINDSSDIFNKENSDNDKACQKVCLELSSLKSKLKEVKDV